MRTPRSALERFDNSRRIFGIYEEFLQKTLRTSSANFDRAHLLSRERENRLLRLTIQKTAMTMTFLLLISQQTNNKNNNTSVKHE